MNMKNKTIGSWLQCAAGALALVTAIALIIYSGAVKDANSLVPTLLIIGAAISAAAFFTGLHPLAIFPGVLFMAAAATYLGSQLANISGRLSGNGIGLTGTSLEALTVFAVLMVLAAALSIAAAFLPDRK